MKSRKKTQSAGRRSGIEANYERLLDASALQHHALLVEMLRNHAAGVLEQLRDAPLGSTRTAVAALAKGVAAIEGAHAQLVAAELAALEAAR